MQGFRFGLSFWRLPGPGIRKYCPSPQPFLEALSNTWRLVLRATVHVSMEALQFISQTTIIIIQPQINENLGFKATISTAEA